MYSKTAGNHGRGKSILVPCIFQVKGEDTSQL